MRVVIKVGTSTLAYENTGLLHICRNGRNSSVVLSDIKNAGHEVILVSSVVPLGWAWENWD